MNEMKLYEKLGVKKFRKFVFKVLYIVCLPAAVVLKIPKGELKNQISITPTNYNIGKNINYEKINNFKKMLAFNTIIHVNAFILCGKEIINIVQGNSSLALTVTTLTLTTINTYCIMLQRYNYLKINKTLKKLKPKYDKEKEQLKEEIKESDNKIIEHEYIYTKIGDRKNKEITVNFDTVLNNASLEQLKTYKKELEDFNKYSDRFTDYYKEKPYTVSIENTKILKLKIKNK